VYVQWNGLANIRLKYSMKFNGLLRKSATEVNEPRQITFPEFRAGWPRGIAPPELPLIRTCPFRHTARHIMSSLRGGTLSGS